MPKDITEMVPNQIKLTIKEQGSEIKGTIELPRLPLSV